MNLEDMTLRELQKEAARALTTIQATNNNIWQFNKQAHHNSHNWYKAGIVWYMKEYGGLPSVAGPGKDVKLVLDV